MTPRVALGSLCLRIQTGDGEVGLAATLAAQLDSKGEWESGLTCLPVEGTSVVSFRNLSCTIGSSKEGQRPLISL